jgi:hypothetical protein
MAQNVQYSKKIEAKPLFEYAGKKAYAKGLLNHMAYSVCTYIRPYDPTLRTVEFMDIQLPSLVRAKLAIALESNIP